MRMTHLFQQRTPTRICWDMTSTKPMTMTSNNIFEACINTYYAMHQHQQETVADFAHRFCEVQNELGNLIPKIHGDLELIHAFVIKLQDDISRELVSREFNFKTLQSLTVISKSDLFHAYQIF